MRFLRSNTAVIVTVGPFYDKTDGVTIETSLTITNERITLTADTDAGSAPTNILDNVTGATAGTANDLNYITGNDAGMMQLELAAADVNRVGRMFLSITDAANHVPVFHEFFVLPQAIYDWLTGVIVPLPANVTQIDGQATSGNNATLNLKQLNIVNNAGSALVASATGGNGHGIAASGNGSGEGVSATGGATGHGIEGIGGATSGNGLRAAGTADSHGIAAVGAGTGNGLNASSTGGIGINAVGGGSSSGVECRGGVTSGIGFLAASGGGDASGFFAEGTGSEPGLGAYAIDDGHGILASAGPTGGNGLHLATTAGVRLSSADITGTVTTDGGNSATSFETDLASAVDDFYKDAYLKITSGALQGQIKKVTGYVGSTKIITVSGGFTGTPADGVTFDIINE